MEPAQEVAVVGCEDKACDGDLLSRGLPDDPLDELIAAAAIVIGGESQAKAVPAGKESEHQANLMRFICPWRVFWLWGGPFSLSLALCWPSRGQASTFCIPRWHS